MRDFAARFHQIRKGAAQCAAPSIETACFRVRSGEPVTACSWKCSSAVTAAISRGGRGHVIGREEARALAEPVEQVRRVVRRRKPAVARGVGLRVARGNMSDARTGGSSAPLPQGRGRLRRSSGVRRACVPASKPWRSKAVLCCCVSGSSSESAAQHAAGSRLRTCHSSRRSSSRGRLARASIQQLTTAPCAAVQTSYCWKCRL